MNKYSFIALFIALLLGICSGAFIVKMQSKKELNKIEIEHREELLKEIEERKIVIKEFGKYILEKEKEIIKHEGTIDKLNSKVRKSKVEVDSVRKRAINLTSTEKEKWLVERYDSLPNTPADTVSIPDTVAARVIDDLILKDGLVKEVELKDSIITEYQEKDTTYQQIISLHERKDVEQDSVISKQDQVSLSLTSELKEEKKKNIKAKLIIIGEAILIGLLIIL